jgi:hypothetical protein
MGEDKITVSWDEIQKQESAVTSAAPSVAPGEAQAPAKARKRRGLRALVYILVGAIVLGGAGGGIWFWLLRSQLGSTDRKSTAAIEDVLKQDAACNQDSASVAEVVGRMRAIDTSACPNDFRSAYLGHVHAWDMMADMEREAVELKNQSESAATIVESFIRGFLGNPFGKAGEPGDAQSQLQKRFKEAAQQIKLTFHHVEEVAVAHGARLPTK